MNAQGCVTLTIRGAVASVTFDRPSARNAMTWTMYEQLAQICTDLAVRGDVRVVTFRGAGGQAFVAGTDIAQFQHFRSGDDGVAYERRIDEGIALIESLPMPTVAAIDGWAVGGGLVIAAACDFRIATPASRFGVPIARTLGNTLSMANLARLKAAFGPAAAKRMLLLAEVLDADQAAASGFLYDICSATELDASLAAFCERLLDLAPVTQRVAKEGLRRLASAHLPDGDDLVRQCYGSADFHHGVEAFVARRTPVWQGN
ncbi:MAG: enoyl-CoA hydratase [Variovorax sp.]|nr:MAG: enoyl-CoA hydratase [Variovorax sp.]